MGDEYAVVCDGETVGYVQMTRRGLYRHFDCRCRLMDKGIYRLWMDVGNESVPLGVLTPEGTEFTLRTRIPEKQIPEGTVVFRAAQKRPKAKGIFVPLDPQEPFAYLKKLKQARLECREGIVGAIFPE